MRLPPSFTLLQVTPRLDSGGVERTTIDVAAAVVEAGGRALVASAGGRMEPQLAAVGGELIRLKTDSKKLFDLVRLSRALRKVIDDEQVSIVHARSRAPAFAAGRAARRAHVPFVTTYAGIYNADTGLKRWYNGVMARADLVIANSEFTREHLLIEHNADPDLVIAIPRGIDLAAFDPEAVSYERVAAVRAAWRIDAQETRPIILLAGRLTRWKGQGLMLEAFLQMKRMEAVLPLLILAGDDQGRSTWRTELEGRIARSGLSGTVRMVGHTEDMPAAYLAADFAVVPSLDPEAFGRTAVEPQLMGRPVLAAAHGGAQETVVDGETGMLVKPGDAEAWAQAIHAMLEVGPDVWSKMGWAGLARARRLYSRQAMTGATLEAYAELLASRASAPS